jgi:hypothetical protein
MFRTFLLSSNAGSIVYQLPRALYKGELAIKYHNKMICLFTILKFFPILFSNSHINPGILPVLDEDWPIHKRSDQILGDKKQNRKAIRA